MPLIDMEEHRIQLAEAIYLVFIHKYSLVLYHEKVNMERIIKTTIRKIEMQKKRPSMELCLPQSRKKMIVQ